jgi:hypothetical protein
MSFLNGKRAWSSSFTFLIRLPTALHGSMRVDWRTPPPLTVCCHRHDEPEQRECEE